MSPRGSAAVRVVAVVAAARAAAAAGGAGWDPSGARTATMTAVERCWRRSGA